MNDRERFLATMRYQPRDRAPICDFGFWHQTIEMWWEQGLPRWVKPGYDCTDTNKFFGMDIYDVALGRIWGGLMPRFTERVLEDRGDAELVQQNDGVRVVKRKIGETIPLHDAHLLVDRDSWEKHYKWRLNPDTPERYPADWNAAVKTWMDPNRDYPLVLPGGSLYGWLRNWMGVEGLSMVIFDDPVWFEAMLDTITGCIIGTLERFLSSGAQFDGCSIWEDMCYNAGPLLSPSLFKKYLVPRYKQITSLLHKYGVHVVWVDSDGKIDELVPLWMEAGVNCMFPIEVGTWGADPIKFRHQYGRDLLLMGGFDKRILATTKDAIEREVHRLAPLVEEGGYIAFPDHRVHPQVSLDNYLFYLETVRRVWGKGINLKPVLPLEHHTCRHA